MVADLGCHDRLHHGRQRRVAGGDGVVVLEVSALLVGGNAAYSVSVMGCSDLDPTTAPLEVAFDQPAEGGELVVEEGPTPDTRILSVTSHYGVNTSAPQLLEARFKVQL